MFPKKLYTCAYDFLAFCSWSYAIVFLPKCSEETPCQRRSASIYRQCGPSERRPMLSGCSPPKCNKDGSFPSSQCESWGVCHCEFANGTTIPDTEWRVGNTARDCDSIRGKGQFFFFTQQQMYTPTWHTRSTCTQTHALTHQGRSLR